MKPDLSDYQNHSPNQPEQGSRLVSWIVLGLAASGFVALAWYAYQSGSEAVLTQEIASIEAEGGPIKEKPLDAGGEEFLHQDKTIYNVLAQSDAPERVEKLLPEPEEPMIPVVNEATEQAQEIPKANTWINEKLRVTEAPDTLSNESTTAPLGEEAQEAATETQPPKQAPEPEIVKAPEPVAVPKPKPEVKAAPEPKPAPVVRAAAPKLKSGGHKIQLGAFGSDGEAETNWVRIRSKHSSVLADHAHMVVRADLPKGTFYRLRVAGFNSKDAADAACATLSKNGQGCFYAGK